MSAWPAVIWKSSFADDMKDGILEFGGVKDGDTKLDEFIEQSGLPRDELRR